VHILLTNDDGIYAPGLTALESELQSLGEVTVVAPATEQSGVGHSITYLTPLVVKEVFDGERRRGWAVEGSPADSVKIGVFEFCPKRPDLVVSGINYGLNAGINVLYSGTVAAAIEGAFFEIPSIAVSLEYEEHARFERAAVLVRKTIEQILAHPNPPARLFNLNIPTAALTGAPKLRVVPMGTERYGEQFERRTDPRGRHYYWAIGGPPTHDENQHETDLSALAAGHISLTPLDFDLTKADAMETMRQWQFRW
jgi:5'-nucleotidase